MCSKNKDAPDPETNAALAVQKPRRNGWSWPPHPFQFLAWFFLLFFGFVHFVVLVPVMPAEWQIAGYVVVGIILGLHCVLHIWSLSINPADDNVIRKWKGLEPKRYDRTLQAHVIENNRCYICDTDVCASAKHCRLCNKCVSGFDHHCRWLNSCIGEKNYRLFISCLVSALVGAILILAVTVYIIVMYFHNPSALHYAQQGILVGNTDPTVASDVPVIAATLSVNGTALPTSTPVQSTTTLYKYYIFAEVPGAAFISVVILTTVLCLVAIGLLGHLLCFHIYLMCNKLSTYDYIMRGREKAKKSTPESSMQNLKGNKVAPVAVISRDEGLHESMENGYVPDNGYHHGGYDPNSSDEDTRAMQRQYEEVLMEDEALSPRLTARSSGRRRPKSSERELHDREVERPRKTKRAKNEEASKQRKVEVAAIAANGTYTPRGYHINQKLPSITPSPTPLNDVITPACPPSPYHSSSAESLQEIPLSTIRNGYEQLPSPRGSPNPTATEPTTQKSHSKNKRRKAKPKERRPRPQDVPPLELTNTVTDGEYSMRSDVTTAQSGRLQPVLHMATSEV